MKIILPAANRKINEEEISISPRDLGVPMGRR